MTDNKDNLTEAQLLSALGNDYKLHFYEKTTSTNDVCKSIAAEGAEKNTVVVAKSQSAGRGRITHSFFSPEGGIYLTLLRKPDIKPEQLTLITPAVAVAVFDALVSYDMTLEKRLKIKYVNDVKLDGKKLCGILTEGAFDGDVLNYCVIGVGLNLYKCDYPDDIADIVTYLYDKQKIGLKAKLIAKICDNIVKYTDNIGILNDIQSRYYSLLEKMPEQS